MTATRTEQQGAVAIMVGLTIVVLVAFLGMAVDLGRLFITKSELSDAADACALAATAELNGAADALDRAVSAGTTTGQRNKVGFQGSAVTIFPADITFSANLNGAYLDKTAAVPANMKYAKCTLPQTGILPYFMQVMGFGAQTVTSHAIATLAPGITNCGLPIAMCKLPTTTVCDDGTASDAMGMCKNQWYCSKFTPGGGTANPSACPGYGSTGNFNLIDFTPPGGGASELEAIITGAGQCNLNITNPVGQTGVQASLDKAWNSRFGYYKGSLNLTNAPPDSTGFAYTPSSWPVLPRPKNAYSGSAPNGAPNLTAARASHRIYQEENAPYPANLNLHGYTNSTSADLTGRANRRVVVVPVVDCAGWAGSQTTPIVKFACILMLHPMDRPQDPLYLEYLGLSDEPGNPCASTGLPGGPGSVGPKVPALVR
ncbi:MAG: pilus assembly protein TadG-related protein [Rugosibacter sp.]|nr:pilus assembly protein TadG-related protein [Rugosibacter sp.]